MSMLSPPTRCARVKAFVLLFCCVLLMWPVVAEGRLPQVANSNGDPIGGERSDDVGGGAGGAGGFGYGDQTAMPSDEKREYSRMNSLIQQAAVFFYNLLFIDEKENEQDYNANIDSDEALE